MSAGILLRSELLFMCKLWNDLSAEGLHATFYLRQPERHMEGVKWTASYYPGQVEKKKSQDTVWWEQSKRLTSSW